MGNAWRKKECLLRRPKWLGVGWEVVTQGWHRQVMHLKDFIFLSEVGSHCITLSQRWDIVWLMLQQDYSGSWVESRLEFNFKKRRRGGLWDLGMGGGGGQGWMWAVWERWWWLQGFCLEQLEECRGHEPGRGRLKTERAWDFSVQFWLPFLDI